MRPEPAKRGRSSKATRNMILNAALKEFAEQGYDGATTASIARRVGVTQPLVHYHFGSKEALWRATVDEIFARLFDQVESSETHVEGMGPAATFVTLTYRFIDFAVANPEFARLVNNEGVVHSPRLTWMVETYLGPLFKRWGGYVDEAKAAGLLKNIPTHFVISAFLGASEYFFDLAPLIREVYGIDPRSPENQKAYGDAMVEMFLEGATARGEDEDAD